MIKAVIFDMDGIIIDSEPCYIEHLIQIFAHFGITVTKDELISIAGGTRKHYNAAINPRIENIVSREEFDAYTNQYYLENPVPYCQIVFPHLVEILEWIKSKGYRIALASSSYQYEIAQVLDETQLHEYFEFILSGDMFKEAKPNPDIYLTCIDKLGLSADECIAIEDSEYGISAAKGANLTCIAREDKRFGYNQTQADYLIQDLMDIKDILEKLI
ncbi:MAG: HAD family phosphatase [Erysipelotrichaceae bacterium]|nr:HAD family phosphatase [Erysipelotrichaceae bacterium]